MSIDEKKLGDLLAARMAKKAAIAQASALHVQSQRALVKAASEERAASAALDAFLAGAPAEPAEPAEPSPEPAKEPSPDVLPSPGASSGQATSGYATSGR
jgi:hypothetical protein